jgi:hypothetical protein
VARHHFGQPWFPSWFSHGFRLLVTFYCLENLLGVAVDHSQYQAEGGKLSVGESAITLGKFRQAMVSSLDKRLGVRFGSK